ncbi:MAG: TIGR01620 family protein [Alphaproteobacteria bacterium]|nr:TIGR01620 family protein [Alphaproteobacteria bacterium]
MTSHPNPPRSPQAFRIKGDEPQRKQAHAPRRSQPRIEFAAAPEASPLVEAPMAEANAARRRTPWAYLLLVSLLSLLGLWFSMTLAKMIADLFAWSLTLGWISVALAALAGLALLVIVSREIWSLWRLRQIEHLQVDSARAINQNDTAAATAARRELKQLYTGRPDMAWALRSWAEHEGDIIDPPAAMRLAERILLEPLDEAAHRIIARRARRVTLLTTVTPTAALDMLLVGAQNLFMIRELAELYGSRPSFIATLRLTRMVITHLAVAAGLALSDNFLHLFVGKGLLGRLSARFGEGAINGILTARIGLAASDVCRPIARESSKRETLASLAKEIATFAKDAEAETPEVEQKA